MKTIFYFSKRSLLLWYLSAVILGSQIVIIFNSYNTELNQLVTLVSKNVLIPFLISVAMLMIGVIGGLILSREIDAIPINNGELIEEER